MADAKLSGLSALSVPDLLDLIYSVDVSDTTDGAGGSSRQVTVQRLLGSLPSICCGRLTPTVSTPYAHSTTGQDTLYWEPYLGNLMALYDGTRWGLYSMTNRQIGLTQTLSCTGSSGSTTLTPTTVPSRLVAGMKVSGVNIRAGSTVVSTTSTTITLSATTTGVVSGNITFKCPANTNYDIFGVVDNSTLALRFSNPWTNDTTRADALTTLNGIDVNSAVIASGQAQAIAANCGRYLGTVRVSATDGFVDFSKGGISSQLGGFRGVWNRYNQVPLEMLVIDTTDTWPYITHTWRLANGLTQPANCCRYVTGDASTRVFAKVGHHAILVSNGTHAVGAGIGIDSSIAYSGQAQNAYNNGASTLLFPIGGEYVGEPGLGYHYLSWLEIGETGTTFCGDNGGDLQSGLNAWFMG